MSIHAQQAEEHLGSDASGDDWQVLPRIYESHINVAVVERTLPATISDFVASHVLTGRPLNIRRSVDTPEAVRQLLPEHLREDSRARPWIEDLVMLTDAWFCLFNAEAAGVRLSTLDKAMCPRFHVDRVPVRLVTTYGGPGTEWLPNGEVDRSVLGRPLGDAVDPNTRSRRIQQLGSGDIGLLKGEIWPDNEGNGLVHRSPQIQPPQKRLLFSLDFA